MWLGIVLLLIIFIGMLILIAKDIMERAALVFCCAILAFFVIVFIEDKSPVIFVEFIFGTHDDGYINFRTIALIFGILIISTVCYRTGFFQFIAFKMIQLTKGEPRKILASIALLTFGVSSILADTITAIILIPLTITVCRTIRMNPVPMVIISALNIKIGATVLPISSISSILITSYQEISFIDYFTTAGFISITMAIITLFIFLILYGKSLPKEKPQGFEAFLEYDPWTFVKDRRMMLIATSVLFGVIVGLILIPSTLLKPEAISCTGAVIILIVNRNSAAEILKEVDFNLLLYLMGVFAITGSLQAVGLIDILGAGLSSFDNIDHGIAFLILLWIGAIASSLIDNVPITQLLLPFINIVMGAKGTPAANMGSLGLALGVIWGDNLSPFGDSILPLNIAKQNRVTIKPSEFFKVGFGLTLFQLSLISTVVLLIFDPLYGIILAVFMISIIFLLISLKKKKSKVLISETEKSNLI